tara:strand:- start:1030 stop:1725 length:696 start_codon:yes stop_codon:yes gene_type:complete
MREEDIIQELEEQEGEIPGRSLLFRIFQGVIALLVLFGFLYLSGLYQYFFFQRTPLSVQQERVESAIDAERITVPLTVFVLQNSETNGSKRTEPEVLALVEKASQIWEQASIGLTVRDIHILERSDKEIDLLLDSSYLFFQGVEELDTSAINVFLTANLRGVNGLAFSGFLAIAIADYTSVYDFRVLAHEVGHILGLNHIESPGQLMYQGANGFELSLQEILRAREKAARF